MLLKRLEKRGKWRNKFVSYYECSKRHYILANALILCTWLKYPYSLMFYIFDLLILHTNAYDVLVESYSFEQNNLHIGESASCHNKKNFSLIEWEVECEKMRI